MNIYHIKRKSPGGYDTYSAAVVVAPNAKTARKMNPRNGELMTKDDWQAFRYSGWVASPDDVAVVCLGPARLSTQRLILSSYHAD